MDMDWNKVQELITEGYITKRKHPTKDLWVLSYTDKTQWDRNWTPETTACRGLVVDAENNIKGQAMKKFFNLNEREEDVTWPPVSIQEKLDGSLIHCKYY